MGLRERLTAADRLATVVSSVSVASPDHPNRGGLTGDGPGTDPPEHDHGDGDGGGDGESPDPTGDAGTAARLSMSLPGARRRSRGADVDTGRAGLTRGV